jgi:putative Mg2+ transporter-C (MgtC) family protein
MGKNGEGAQSTMDWEEALLQLVAMVVAAVLGGLMGLEREARGRWAGLRTHMLVAIGTCLFVLVGLAVAGEQERATVLSRVIQGICAGIGFIGAGTILKLTDKIEIKGLTTASSIWTAAAVGAACGVQHYEMAVPAAVLALIILEACRQLECWLSPPLQKPYPAAEEAEPERPATRRRKKRKMQEGLDKRNRGQTP